MSAYTHADARQTSAPGLDRAANRYSPSSERARAVRVRSRKPERISVRPNFHLEAATLDFGFSRTLLSLKIVYGSASAERLRSPREAPSMTRDAIH